MSSLTLNPFRLWLDKLESDKDYLVTHEILLDLKDLINSRIQCIESVDDAFKVLEYLNANKAITLTKNKDSSFIIKKNI